RPRGGPEKTDGSERDEARAPPELRDEQLRQRHGEQSADPRAEEHDAAGAAALARREPLREAAHDVGERPRFAGAEEESDRDERRQALHGAGQHGKARPPEDDAGEDTTRSAHVAEPA